MKYIFMVAGKGSRLQPLTFKHPKSMYKLDENTTLLQRMVGLIKKHDPEADIVLVTGHMHRRIEEQVEGVRYIYNPFYEVTNSIASLWFAKEELDADNVILIDGDIVMEDELVANVLCKPVDKPVVLVDSSIKTDGDYNVEVSGDQVLVMSKDLDNYYGEYAGVTLLDRESARLMKTEMESMVEDGYYDQWYENALVQLIFKNDFKLYYTDITNYDWTEVDSVNDLLLAKRIHTQELTAD
ncbi:Choline kinase [Ruminococcus sp. YRD2003]|uniref:phosphocholine cytidylyltransferase family protein n=1 Tax=Ruminococcus sp. YRD2003 TaxID=1452313 RepID=UPI0008D80D92|nr:Choline kinase [Ruminococcus flavefaciens]